MVPFLFAEMIISKYFPHFCIGKENTNRKEGKREKWDDEMNDKSLYWKIMNAKCVEFWKRLFRGHRDKRMKKKNVLLFFESDPPMPSLSHINQHPRFFSVFLFLFFGLSLPPLLLFLVFLSPKINITYKTQWKKYYYQVIVLGNFCRVIFSKNAHFPTEKMKWKCMLTHREKKQRTSRSFEVDVFFLIKNWIERWN